MEKCTEYYNAADIFGENVFNDSVMQARLPKKVYQKLKNTRECCLYIVNKEIVEESDIIVGTF